MSPLPAVGVFVGGQGRRMGGVAKGLLCHGGQSLVERVLAACRAAADPLPLERLFLVGRASAYAGSGVPSLDDAPAGVGPMGGLRALLAAAQAARVDAVALAVDLPYLRPELVRRLFLEQPGALALAPRQAGRWQPLFARYRPEAVLPVLDAALAAGHTSLQAIFARLQALGPAAASTLGGRRAGSEPRVVELELSDAEQDWLRDWDQPGDMAGPAPADGAERVGAARPGDGER